MARGKVTVKYGFEARSSRGDREVRYETVTAATPDEAERELARRLNRRYGRGRWVEEQR